MDTTPLLTSGALTICSSMGGMQHLLFPVASAPGPICSAWNQSVSLVPLYGCSIIICLEALQSATSYPGAQFYVCIYTVSRELIRCWLLRGFQMSCAQISVSGSSGTSTPSTVSFPGAYKCGFYASLLDEPRLTFFWSHRPWYRHVDFWHLKLHPSWYVTW